MNQSNHTAQSERAGKAIAVGIITAVTALTALASYLPSCWIDDAEICYKKGQFAFAAGGAAAGRGCPDHCVFPQDLYRPTVREFDPEIDCSGGKEGTRFSPNSYLTTLDLQKRWKNPHLGPGCRDIGRPLKGKCRNGHGFIIECDGTEVDPNSEECD